MRVGQAELVVRRDRETLVWLLGLSGTNLALTLPDTLPALPAAPEPPLEVEDDDRMDHEGGKRDGTVDDIEISCPLSIEFNDAPG